MQQQFTAQEIEQATGTPDVAYLGTGTFGETWRVGPDEAYKIIYRSDTDLERLRREIESYRRVDSKHVVRLIDVRPLEVAGRELVAMIFEFIEGGDLTAAIEAGRPTDDQLIRLAEGLLKGLSALHAASLLHRDLKPANIALRGGDYAHPVILDLGLAKLMDVETITRYPQRIGTPLYMAPEQLQAQRATKASDLWAVGVILYEAATGEHPFRQNDEDMSWDEFFRRVANKPARLQNIHSKIADLIDRFLTETVYKRGTVARAIKEIEGIQ